MPISPIEAVLALVVVTIASAVQGALGFGAALLAAPALLILDPAFVPGPVLFSNFVLTLLVARREWSSVDMSGVRFMVPGRLVGTLLAAGLLVELSPATFDLAFGTLVLIAVGLSILRGQPKRSRAIITAAGMASGLMGTMSSIGGPPVALVYQGAPPPVLRATLSVNLMVGAIVSILVLWAVDRFGETELMLSALLVPGALAGYGLSHFGIAWASPQRVRLAVLTLSTASAIGVMWRALTSTS